MVAGVSETAPGLNTMFCDRWGANGRDRSTGLERRLKLDWTAFSILWIPFIVTPMAFESVPGRQHCFIRLLC